MKFAIFDYDETLSKGMVFPELLYQAEKEKVIKAGYKVRYDKLWEEYRDGKYTYEVFVNKSTDIILEHIDGYKVVDITKSARDSKIMQKRINSWVNDLFKILHDKDYLIVVISATPIEILDVIQETIDFDTFFGTIVKTKDGKYQKEVKKLVNNSEKSKIVRSITKEADFVIGMGDSEGDIEMLKTVDKPFLYNPFEDTKDEAKKYNIPVLNSKNVIEEISKILI